MDRDHNTAIGWYKSIVEPMRDIQRRITPRIGIIESKVEFLYNKEESTNGN